MKQRIFWLVKILATRLVVRDGFRAAATSMVDSTSRIGKYCKIGRRSTIFKSSLGDYSYISSGASIRRTDVGRFCSIGPEVLIGGLGTHPTQWISTHPAFYSTKMQAGRSFVENDIVDELKQTAVGNDVWIGARALILDGVRVGDGAIIAAGSVVTRDVEPYTIVGGTPAKIIRRRFSDSVCAALLELEWWNFPGETLQSLSTEFTQERDWTSHDILLLGTIGSPQSR